MMMNNCLQNLVVQKTNYRIRSVGRGDSEAFLWSDDQSPEYHKSIDTYKQTLSSYYMREDSALKGDYFVSSVADGTSAGVYRHHVARMDSMVRCSKEQRFPQVCKVKGRFKRLSPASD
jgi:hypothetical protein